MSGKETVATTDANPRGPRTTRPRAKPKEGGRAKRSCSFVLSSRYRSVGQEQV